MFDGLKSMVQKAARDDLESLLYIVTKVAVIIIEIIAIFSNTRSETRFAGLLARLPVGNEIILRSPTSMKRDHTFGDIWSS